MSAETTAEAEAAEIAEEITEDDNADEADKEAESVVVATRVPPTVLVGVPLVPEAAVRFDVEDAEVIARMEEDVEFVCSVHVIR